MRDRIILWEAHRGGGGGFEMPESCPVSFEYGWMLGGIPEADVNLTVDGELISLHDSTLARTTNAPDNVKNIPVNELTFAEIRKWDVVSEEFSNQKIPSLKELFRCLQKDSEKKLILDYKNVPIELLAQLIVDYNVMSQLTFASCDYELGSHIKKLLPEIKVKIWIGGNKNEIEKKFFKLSQKSFFGFEEVQLHLNDKPNSIWRYDLSQEFIKEALKKCKESNVLLQVLPWRFERKDLFAILDLGVRSFAVDFPNKFCRTTADYFAQNWS